MRNDHREGAVLVDDMTLPEVWLSLHQSTQAWSRQAGQPDGAIAQARMTDSDRRLLRCLASVDHQRWIGLCLASGLTATGVIATAWAGQAVLADVAVNWGNVVMDQGQVLAPSARLFPGHLVPVFATMSAALAWTGSNDALLALIIADQSAMTCDLSPSQLAAAPPLISAALALRGNK
jgi:hypothetical protein